MESAETDLPEPDSPTSASVSPLLSEKETWSTASVVLPPWRKATERSLTSRSGSLMRRSFADQAHRAPLSPMKTSSVSMMETTKKPVKPSHGACRFCLALAEQFAERGRARRQSEAEIVERGQRRHRARENEGHEGDRRHQRIGQEMLEHDLHVAEAERPRGAHIFEIARPQKFGAHHADQRRPGEQHEDEEQDPEGRRDEGRQNDEQIERRHRRPDVDEALEQQIGPAAEIALHGARGDADDRREARSGSDRRPPRCGSRR